MKIVVHTAFGVFESKTREVTPADRQQLEDMLKKCVSEGTYMHFDSASGKVLLSHDVVRNCVIELVD